MFYLRETNFQADYKLLFITANLLTVIINLLPSRRTVNSLRNYAIFIVSYMALIIFYQGYEYSRLFHLYFLAALFVYSVVVRYGNLAGLLEKSLLPNNFERKVLVIGESPEESIVQFINGRRGNYQCIGFLSDKRPAQANLRELQLGKINDIEKILDRDSVDEVVISTSLLTVEKIDRIIKTAEKYHTTVSILPPYFQFLSEQPCQTEHWMGVPVTAIYHSKLALKSYQISKRVLDIGVSLFFLVAVFPVFFLIVAPAIWLSNKGPIFFKQLRKGHKQEPFFCYKFRTMTIGNKAEEIQQARKHDPRVTAVGRTLRNTSIDEFPQFLNVLAGNMSLVGPRPHMVEHDDLYEKSIDRYNVRFVAKPGITGWAQINGHRGSTEKPGQMQQRIEHDLWYIKNWSIWLDLKIIVLTAVSMVFKNDPNAY
ncbi:MAG TPA: exopolysaccharide biosynthesis polyprenyl glycosylphosphotransferase [Pyrinomonadaceae bacterium]|nr:exopolysaccharide biosynthesis polyprenyl glycosylphosphotransferase [Pyrinomonadaceae bacterium]